MGDGVGELLDRRTRVVADWPEPGVTFRDLTPLLADPAAFGAVLDAMVGAVRGLGRVDVVAGIEARGFWFAPAVADRLGAGFAPIRKAGKLPGDVHAETYDLEYGTATLEVAADAFAPGAHVVLLDDVLATGGTLAAAARLVDAAGARVVGAVLAVELADLGGRAATDPLPVLALQTIGGDAP